MLLKNEAFRPTKIERLDTQSYITMTGGTAIMRNINSEAFLSVQFIDNGLLYVI